MLNKYLEIIDLADILGYYAAMCCFWRLSDRLVTLDRPKIRLPFLQYFQLSTPL
jgi:hypothetical protein